MSAHTVIPIHGVAAVSHMMTMRPLERRPGATLRRAGRRADAGAYVDGE